MPQPRTASRLVRVARPVLRHTVRRTIQGRRLDPGDETRGRFLRSDADRLVADTVRQADALWEVAGLEEVTTRGARLNVAFAVLTTALYRALLALRVPEDHAAELTADSAWHLYALGGRSLRRIATIRAPGDHERMATALRLLLRFPFGAPGRPAYEVEVADDGEEFTTNWTWCPPQAFVRRLVTQQGDRGELTAFRRSWCSFDWAFNDLLAGGNGGYRRPHTMSDGDPFCDMTWSVTPVAVRTTEGSRPGGASRR